MKLGVGAALVWLVVVVLGVIGSSACTGGWVGPADITEANRLCESHGGYTHIGSNDAFVVGSATTQPGIGDYKVICKDNMVFKVAK